MLEIREVSFERRLESFSLTCKPGEIHAILGANGSGKSTLLRVIMGLLPPRQGSILWEGKPLHQKTREEISQIATWLPQQLQTPFDYSVKEFVSMGRYMHEGRGCIETYLEKCDLYPFLHKPVRELSQGEKQRVYFARALATEAPILLLDEPQAHLDLRWQRRFWSLLQELSQEGKIPIVANHDLPSSKKYCSHATYLERGRIILQGAVLELDFPSFFA